MLTTSMLPLRMLGLLMLMFSLCDAESRCPTEVTLDPPEVLAEYGTLVRVNCSSAGKEHDGMNWRVGDTDHPIEYDNYYVLQLLNLSDFFVTAECRIKWNETHECSQGLKINVYKNPETVTLFQSTYGAALESTYYEMQCDVDDVAPIHNLTLRWYKNNETIKTDYFTNITKRPVSESSNLTVSLNRGEKEAQFRCEAQLDFGGHASQPPVTSNVYTLSAHYAPVLKNKMEDVYLSEGEYAILNCEAEGDPAPGFRWSRDGVNLMDRTNELNISTATSAIYNCTATNYRGSTTKQIRVHVENPTPVPSTPESCPIVLIPAEIVVRFGDPTSATCNASTKDLSLMGWEATKGGKATNERVITWTVEKVDSWGEQPLCYINVKEMQCKKSLNIILYQTPDNVLVSAMDPGPMVEGREYRLNCFITNVAPLEKLKLIWYRGDETMLSRVFSNTTNTPTNVSFDLEITPNRADNRAHFRCAAELHLGPNGPALVPTVTSSPYEAVVHYAPVLKNKTEDVYLSEGEYAILNCEAEGDPAPGFRWSRDGVNLMDRTNELNISTATSAIYNCTATNYRGSTTKQIRVHVENPTPVPSTPESCPIVLIPAEIVVRFGDPTSATCNASTKDLISMGWEATKGGKATNERVITWTVEKVDSWDEQPLCYINVKEKQCTKALNIILYKTPDNVLVSAMDPGPMVEGREYRLNCFITNVAPLEKLKLIWYRGDETMLSRVFSNTTNTPTNVSFDLKVTPNRADNRAHFRCAAELHLGPNGPAFVPTVTSSPYEAVVHYAPVFNGSNSEEEVNVISGDNVTLDCSADGNPHPEITWESSAALNVMVTTRGRQKSIIVTEATSTNAGSYVCVARNVVGNVDKTVKLVVKDRPQLKAKGGTVIWWFLILLIILLILILAIYVHLSRRQGRYTFVPNEANQDPGIPMTPQTNGV